MSVSGPKTGAARPTSQRLIAAKGPVPSKSLPVWADMKKITPAPQGDDNPGEYEVGSLRHRR